ncbi:MAG TPA: CRTAC1 family protein [Gammaproteobacteria bacterium]
MTKSAVRKLVGLVPFALIAACDAGSGNGAPASAPEAAGPAPAPSPTAEPGAPFVNVADAANISFRVGYTRPYLFRGQRAASEASFGGVAAGDCDSDGDIDLFITYGNTGGPDDGGGANRLYLNQLAEQDNGLLFEDIAESAGVANTRADGKGNDRHSGPAFADMDGDGDLDLFLGGIHGDPSKIYENRGGCLFADVTANSPEIEALRATHTLSAGFGDYDLDGDLDMFLTHWGTSDTVYVGDDLRYGESEHLWRNDSDASGIRFVNVSEEAGISDLTWGTRARNFYIWPQDADFTFTATFARIDNDLWPDIAIAADFGTTQVAINNGDGTFASLDNPGLFDAQFGMGSALGDYDNDGDLDWFVTSIMGPGDPEIGLAPWGNRLFVNDGSPTLFADETDRLGVADGSWGWAACLADIDNDSDLDIYHTNGWSEPYLGHQVWQTPASRAFVLGEDGTYTEAAAALGLAENVSSRGLVCADFDHDGDTDLFEVTGAAGNSARLWENRTAAADNNFLRVKLNGLPPNTEAAGARIFVQAGDTRQMREIMVGSNYASQNPTVQLFGLGAAAAADEILIEWPPLDTAEGPVRLGTLINGPIAAGGPGQTLVISHPELPPP